MSADQCRLVLRGPTGATVACHPIEMAFAKLKTLIRKAAARTCDALWQTVGHACDLFTEQECCNYFGAAGCEAD